MCGAHSSEDTIENKLPSHPFGSNSHRQLLNQGLGDSGQIVFLDTGKSQSVFTQVVTFCTLFCCFSLSIYLGDSSVLKELLHTFPGCIVLRSAHFAA